MKFNIINENLNFSTHGKLDRIQCQPGRTDQQVQQDKDSEGESGYLKDSLPQCRMDSGHTQL